MKSLAALFILILACSCGALKDSPKYQLGNGAYHYREGKSEYQKTYVRADGDSLTVYELPTREVLTLPSQHTHYFVTRSFDVDVMTVPFKYRPASENLPPQLNTDFNGNVFLGYRVDRFKSKYKNIAGGPERKYTHRGVTAGLFGGIASTTMSPWTTNNKMTDEYSGVVFSRGAAVMLGINSLTVGLGVGFDSLNGRDRELWIYQNRPWYGLTVGLNLN
jgi:hypothetical protein